MDSFLEKYAGREEELMNQLVAKFGPEPSDGQPTQQQGGQSSLSHRERLIRFYSKYAPDKLSAVDAALERYRGKEVEMFAALELKYGPEPPLDSPSPSGAAPTSSKFKERLTRFFAQYCPDRMDSIDMMLQKYAGREEDMIKQLVAKFGPEPAAAASPAAGPSSPRAVLSGNGASYKERVVRLLSAYAPDKVGNADALLTKFAGKEEELIQNLVSKFGPEPAAAAAAPKPNSESDPSSYRSRVTRILSKHAPDRLGKVDALLQQYRGKEDELIQYLVDKFGPEEEKPRSTQQNPPQAETKRGEQAAKQPTPPPMPVTWRSWLEKRIGQIGIADHDKRFPVSTDDGKENMACLVLMREFCPDGILPPSPKSASGPDEVAAKSETSLPSDHDAGKESFVHDDFRKVVGDRERFTLDSIATLRKWEAETLTVAAATGAEENAARIALKAEEASDAKRIEALIIDRQRRRSLVLEKALDMIHSVEGQLRAETEKVQQIEAAGRLQWFREKRLEIMRSTRPAQVDQLQAKFSRWKNLVKEQDEEIKELAFERMQHNMSHAYSPRGEWPRGGSSGHSFSPRGGIGGGSQMSPQSPGSFVRSVMASAEVERVREYGTPRSRQYPAAAASSIPRGANGEGSPLSGTRLLGSLSMSKSPSRLGTTPRTTASPKARTPGGFEHKWLIPKTVLQPFTRPGLS